MHGFLEDKDGQGDISFPLHAGRQCPSLSPADRHLPFLLPFTHLPLQLAFPSLPPPYTRTPSPFPTSPTALLPFPPPHTHHTPLTHTIPHPFHCRLPATFPTTCPFALGGIPSSFSRRGTISGRGQTMRWAGGVWHGLGQDGQAELNGWQDLHACWNNARLMPRRGFLLLLASPRIFPSTLAHLLYTVTGQTNTGGLLLDSGRRTGQTSQDRCWPAASSSAAAACYIRLTPAPVTLLCYSASILYFSTLHLSFMLHACMLLPGCLYLLQGGRKKIPWNSHLEMNTLFELWHGGRRHGVYALSERRQTGSSSYLPDRPSSLYQLPLEESGMPFGYYLARRAQT